MGQTNNACAIAGKAMYDNKSLQLCHHKHTHPALPHVGLSAHTRHVTSPQPS